MATKIGRGVPDKKLPETTVEGTKVFVGEVIDKSIEGRAPEKDTIRTGAKKN